MPSKEDLLAAAELATTVTDGTICQLLHAILQSEGALQSIATAVGREFGQQETVESIRERISEAVTALERTGVAMNAAADDLESQAHRIATDLRLAAHAIYPEGHTSSDTSSDRSRRRR